MSAQQTILRVQTNIPENFSLSGTTGLNVLSGSYSGYTGTGTQIDPYTYSHTNGTNPGSLFNMNYQAVGNGTIVISYETNQSVVPNFVNENFLTVTYLGQRTGVVVYPVSEQDYYGQSIGSIQYDVKDGDKLRLTYHSEISGGVVSGTTFFVPDENSVVYTPNTYENLDLYSDAPIKINKSFAELQDIGKKNSDFSVGLTLPGTKKNNRFFETFYNVDSSLIFFDITKRVSCDILIEDQSYFRGYLKLNKINVRNSAVEYDVTLYSTVSDLFGKIGNNLLKDLNFNDAEFHFNHQFHWKNIIAQYQLDPNLYNIDTPQMVLYPIVHNGYNYDGDDVILSGATNQTRLYTSTINGSYANLAAFTGAGGQRWRINSPLDGIVDNQLKPSLSIYGIVKNMFKGYGYTISSKFLETPWFKNLQLYGYFSSTDTKLSFYYRPEECYPLSGVEILIDFFGGIVYTVKKGTLNPITCCVDINFTIEYQEEYGYVYYDYTIPAGAYSTNIFSGSYDISWVGPYTYDVNYRYGTPAYDPATVTDNTLIPIIDNQIVDFSLLIDPKFKQIDFLSSIAKKFNLVFVPNPDAPNDIIIEPYDYYVNSGDIHDWTEKLSYDQGFTVEPALNYIESTLLLTDSEDGDDGNKLFKDTYNRLYGENIVNNTTDFKSSNKEIKTIFSPEVIRTWDSRVGLPLGINYVGSSSEKEGGSVSYQYKGLKSKPKLFYWLGNYPPFIDQVGEIYTLSNVNTSIFRIAPSSGTSPFGFGNEQWGTINAPVISHTSTIGNPDENKIVNDNVTVLFGSEKPVDLGVSTYDTYTDNNLYTLFYQNRIQNLYDKNTRFLSGKFNLKLNDILNLKPNDLIKIQEQYFTWNKVKEYNMVEDELTQVELIQTNRVVKTYPDRYFVYTYCDGGQYTYKFKTYFDYTESQLVGGDRFGVNGYSPAVMSNYFWSTFYDYMVGALGGNVSGFTFVVDSFGYGRMKANIIEVTEETWLASAAEPWFEDPARYALWGYSRTTPDWSNSGFDYPLYISLGNQAVLNVAEDCSAMASLLSSMSITTNNPPPPIAPTGTPLPPPTATPTPTPTPVVQSGLSGDGSLILTFDEGNGDATISIFVGDTLGGGNDNRTTRYDNVTNLYSTFLNDGEYIRVFVYGIISGTYDVTTMEMIRRDYTNDDQGGDMGIIDTAISPIGSGLISNFRYYDFLISTNPDAYNYEYRLNIGVGVPPTPTSTPTPTVTGTPAPTSTPSPSPTSSATPTPSPSPSPTPTPTIDPGAPIEIMLDYFLVSGGYLPPGQSYGVKTVTNYIESPTDSITFGPNNYVNFDRTQYDFQEIYGLAGTTSFDIINTTCWVTTYVGNTALRELRLFRRAKDPIYGNTSWVQIGSKSVNRRQSIPECGSGLLTRTDTVNISQYLDPFDPNFQYKLEYYENYYG